MPSESTRVRSKSPSRRKQRQEKDEDFELDAKSIVASSTQQHQGQQQTTVGIHSNSQYLTSWTVQLVWFVCSFAVLMIASLLSPLQFPYQPLMSFGDVVDFVTPMVLMYQYWLLLMKSRGNRGSLKFANGAFVCCCVIWISGHGLHLSANSIDNLMKRLWRNGELQNEKNLILLSKLVYFYDEILSHFLGTLSLCAMHSLLMFEVHQYRTHTNASLEKKKNPHLNSVQMFVIISACATLFGTLIFAGVIEGATTYLGVPFVIVTEFYLFFIVGSHNLLTSPLEFFFAVANLVSGSLFLWWFTKYGYFPEFSELGLIGAQKGDWLF